MAIHSRQSIFADMSEEEREEMRHQQTVASRQRQLDRLIEEYEASKSIQDTAQRLAMRFGAYVRDALEESSRQEVELYISDIKLCKEVIVIMQQDRRRIRGEIRAMREKHIGT